MAIDPTRFSRVSIGFVDSVRSIADLDPADTGAAFSVTGGFVAGGGAQIDGVFSSVVSVNFASVPGNDSVTTSVTVTGAAVDDAVVVTPSSTWSGSYLDIGVSGQVTAANTVTLSARNSAATAVNPDALNMRVTVISFA